MPFKLIRSCVTAAVAATLMTAGALTVGAWAQQPKHGGTMRIYQRNIPAHRDPAIILIDHLKKIHIEEELESVDSSLWFSKVARKDYVVGLNLTGNAIDDPDQTFYEIFARNTNGP